MTPPPPKKFENEDESSEEESEEEDTPRGVPAAAASKKKWDEEDESDDNVLDSWDAADDSEEERKKTARAEAATAAAAAEKAAKGPRSKRIAEHSVANAAAREAEAAAARKIAKETPAERRERERQQQIEADIKHAEDLFGAVGIGAGSGRGEKAMTIADPQDPTRNIDLSAIDLFKPNTKAGFDKFRDTLVPLVAGNIKKPHYQLFIQDFCRALVKDCSSEQVRAVASKLTTLANEKQKEEKAAEKGGKKKKAAPKANLATVGKLNDSLDTTNYNDAGYDDFDGFM